MFHVKLHFLSFRIDIHRDTQHPHLETDGTWCLSEYDVFKMMQKGTSGKTDAANCMNS